MELVYGSEISFTDGFAIKPARTFVVNTNAPLHSNGFDVQPSAGVATFPHCSNYGDRIFLWRAIGQKLFIEERSLLYSITDGSLCIDFTRTPIIPGTSITIFEEGVLCIVVPTASAIHRFYARLHSKGHDTFSILARIKEDDDFRRFRTSHSLSTPGRPIRASVTHHPSRNTISYCTAEGQLVIVTLGSYTESSDKHEEFTMGEVGLLGKLLGGTDKRVSDACVMKNLRPTSGVTRERKISVQSDIVFAVTRDGWVQAWNVETKKQLPSTIDLNNYFASDGKSLNRDLESADFEEEKSPMEPTETVYSIRAYSFDVDILLIVGCDLAVSGKSVGMRVHILKVSNDQIQHLQMFETSMSVDERLVDLELIQNYFPSKESESLDETQDGELYNPLTAALFSLSALFKSSSAKKTYSMKRISFAIQWKKGRVFTDFDWHSVRQFTSPATTKEEPIGNTDEVEPAIERPYNLSADSSIETLIDVVFDTDIYPFDIVFRAVQIVSDNFRGTLGQVRNNNWPELSKLVDTYLTSVEFNRKFQQKTDRSIRLRLNAPQESQKTALKDFWWALLRACEELDFAARGAISLAPIQFCGDLRIMAVVHRDRMTFLGDNNTEFLEIISSENIPKQGNVEEKFRKLPNKHFIDLIEEASKFADRRVFLMNRERARLTNAKNGVAVVEDDNVENAYDYDSDGRFINIKTALEGPIVKLAAAFVEASTFDNSKPFEDPHPQIFGGSFTQSVVSANIRVSVESRVHFALTLQTLLNAITEKKSRAGAPSFGDVEALSCELREIIRVYRELNEQLDIKIVQNGAKMSIGTWLTSDAEGLSMMKKEGGYGPHGYDEIRENDFNWFVGVTTEAAIRALLSSSEILVLPRRLVLQKQYKVLLTILNSYISETRALKPVITFYRGIAYSGTDHPVKALNSFQSCLDAFSEGNNALRKAVYFLLPKRFDVAQGKDPVEELTASEYFLTVVRFLQEHNHAEEVCSVAVKAIENLPIENESVQLISNTLFNHLTNRREWFQSLKLILRTTLRSETRRASIRELLSLMLACGEWEAIATMKFGEHEQVVEDFLRDAACRQSPSEKKHYFELLFAFYVARKDFRKGACAMYEYARHIESTTCMTPELLRRKRDCLAVVLNLQSVLGMEPDDDRAIYDDATDTNLVFPEPSDDEDELITESDSSGENGKLPSGNKDSGSGTGNNSSPDNSNGTSSSGTGVDLVALKARQMAYALGSDDMDTDDTEDDMKGGSIPLFKRRKLLVLSEKDIRDELVLCSARVGLLSSDQFKGVPPTDLNELFSLLVDNQHFDEAFDIARQFNLDSHRLFFTMTREAIMIDALRDDLNIEMAATHQAGWVRLNRRHCAAVATAEEHWSVVRGLVDAAQAEWPGDSRPLRGSTEAFLSFKLNVPVWLHSVFENNDANDYLRCLVDYESYSIALQVLSDIVEQETLQASQSNARTWLPYGIIDELMIRSADYIRKMSLKSPEDQVVAAEVANLRKSADQKMLIYFRKVADFEQAQKMSSRFFDK
ncbi:NUP160 middle TPR domain-containing protein [Caenorhabditis elegans]|uniref:NUP160 middle TPR domain-containing protein n=1 Tax=Caenorhabditis elegans TaxID=6239 RepID=P91350_CAEEL|nr:Nuclear Pore complex Protein [Caenorhabditis elegans]CCD66430.2 Nuclear Pore complex Protein [Caenorhabditis elegans]